MSRERFNYIGHFDRRNWMVLTWRFHRSDSVPPRSQFWLLVRWWIAIVPTCIATCTLARQGLEEVGIASVRTRLQAVSVLRRDGKASGGPLPLLRQRARATGDYAEGTTEPRLGWADESVTAKAETDDPPDRVQVIRRSPAGLVACVLTATRVKHVGGESSERHQL